MHGGYGNVSIETFGKNRLLKLSSVMYVEELACAERKDHALVVFFQLVVDLCRNQSRQLSLWERFIFVKRFTGTDTRVSFSLLRRRPTGLGEGTRAPTFD